MEEMSLLEYAILIGSIVIGFAVFSLSIARDIKVSDTKKGANHEN